MSRLGCDTAPLIYLRESHADFGPPMVEVARRVDEGAFELVCSTITLTEVLTRPMRLGRMDLVDAYRALLEHHGHVALVDIDPEVACALRSCVPVTTFAHRTRCRSRRPSIWAVVPS